MARSAEPAAPTTASLEYLVTLRNTIASGHPGTIASLARHLHVSSQAASEMVHRLVADAFVRHGQGRELTLTRRGRAVADAVFRRHALLEWLLTDVIGMGWAESDPEAHRLQGALSEAVERQLDAFLGHPEICPHGNPIDAAASRRRPAGVPLSTLASGARATIYRITEEAEEDPALLSYLEARGLRPGAPIAVHANSEPLDSMTLEGPRGSATLGLRPAALIRVLPGTADPALFHHLPRRSLGEPG
jgi:DtxR family Mn-dependent transcriptional regulator